MPVSAALGFAGDGPVETGLSVSVLLSHWLHGVGTF